jgi:Tol biopolymer transport system component
MPAGKTTPVKISTPDGRESHPVYAANGSLAFAGSGSTTTSIYLYDASTKTYQSLTAGTLAVGWR